ncbi:protein ABHD14B [Ditylenchus destructor]|uniref:Protein ABHD14B n=1 Tax=Ditylenchus destructor TaxID=166010 RepID=A0AAD4R3S8_9BILA|nr:protein ABHD14B [Ditylenchus destructor]
MGANERPNASILITLASSFADPQKSGGRGMSHVQLRSQLSDSGTLRSFFSPSHSGRLCHQEWNKEDSTAPPRSIICMSNKNLFLEMLDKDPALRQMIKNANLELNLPENFIKLVPKVELTDNVIEVESHSVFYLRSDPPKDHRVRAHIVLVHDQTNTSSIWKQIGTMQIFSAFGYSCIAPDLPGTGKTGGATVDECSRSSFIHAFITGLGLLEVVIIGTSMAGQYLIPVLSENRSQHSFNVQCWVAVALSDTNKLSVDHLSNVTTPCLALRGAWDTSIGMNSTNILSYLPNSRVVVVPDGKHLCHITNPDFFHKLVLNFLDAVLKHVTKSVFVTNL